MRWAAVTSILLLLSFSGGPVASAAVPPDFQGILNEHVSGPAGTGIVVGVLDHGTVTFYAAGASGLDRPLDEHTVFEIGSITKTFTAALLASMVLDHSVSLNDPVAKYLPPSVHVPSRHGKQITLLNLATQHSGLPRLPTNMDQNEANDPYAGYSVQKMYAFLNSYALPRDPGAQFEYSNYGVALLGIALANRAHTSYAHLLQTRILMPLGMQETALSSTMTAELAARMATGHNEDGDAVKPWSMQAIAPAGAIRSSAADMLKFVRCALGQGPLAKACLFAEQPRATFPGGHIGLVWLHGDVQQVIFHNGATGGFTSCLAVSPDRTKGVIVLSNGGSNTDDIAFHALDAKSVVPKPQAVAQLDEATLSGYAGTYTAPALNLTFTVTHAPGKLAAQLSGQPSARIYPSAKDHFYYRVVPATIDFTRDANGNVNALVIHQDGQGLQFVRAGMPAPSPAAAESAAPSVTLDNATLDEYVGTYAINPTAEFVVKREGDKLMVQLTGQPFFQVFATAKDRFFYKVVDAQIDFQRAANGHISGLILHQNGRDLPAQRRNP